MGSVLALALDAALTLLVYRLASFGWILSWLVAASLVSFFLFGYDKAIAGSDRTRLPERVLLFSALVGGTLGAIAGMLIWRHKTAKTSFQVRLLVVVVIQAALIVAYWLVAGHVP